MNLPEHIAERLKPGLLARPASAPGRWQLYDPGLDQTHQFSEDTPVAGELGSEDLQSNDRAWADGLLRLDLYHAAQSVRRHRDAQEANLEINYLCHYACRHCFQALEPAQHPRATPDRAALWQAADRLLQAGAGEISITGGDIFLHPDLWDLLDYLHERAPRTTLRLLVNGGGLDLGQADVQDRLRRLAGRRLLVKSDFFGHSPELHDGFTRVPGSFLQLVRIVEWLRQAGIACLPTAAVTRLNFDTRFELVNFLDNLTDNCFTVATIIYPSQRRTAPASAELRLAPDQYGELMEERFFAPLAAEYHTFEPQCGGDCQFAVVSAAGDAWGCSFLKVAGDAAPRSSGRLSLSLLDEVDAWRNRAAALAGWHECATCPAQGTCRKCPSFVSAGQMGDDYCTLSRASHVHVRRRVRQALSEGFQFVHAGAAQRLGPWEE